MNWVDLRLKLRFTLVGARVLPLSRVLSTPILNFVQPPLQLLPAEKRRKPAQERWRTASKSSAAAAAETLSESILPTGRQGHQAVAGRRHPGADPAPLAPHDEDRRAAQVDLPGRRGGARVGAPDPEARVLRFREPVGEVADAGDRRGARRRPPRPCRRPRSPPPPAVRGSRGRPPRPARRSGRRRRGCAGPGPGRGRRSGRPACAAARFGRRRGRDRPRRRRPGGRASRRAARAPRPRSPAPARPGARAASPARPPATGRFP